MPTFRIIHVRQLVCSLPRRALWIFGLACCCAAASATGAHSATLAETAARALLPPAEFEMSNETEVRTATHGLRVENSKLCIFSVQYHANFLTITLGWEALQWVDYGTGGVVAPKELVGRNRVYFFGNEPIYKRHNVWSAEKEARNYFRVPQDLYWGTTEIDLERAKQAVESLTAGPCGVPKP